MRVLVTGATGGLGRTVVDALKERGDIVRASGRNLQSAQALRDAGIEVVLGDLTDGTRFSTLLDGVDAVIHCAALSSPWGDYRDFKAINLSATQALLKVASEAGVDRFVFISSPSVYAQMSDRLDLSEQDTIAQPALNAYAATKALAERAVLKANSEKMATVVLRPRAIVGPYDTVLLPRILKIMQTGHFPLLRRGKALVELTDARDVADAVLRAFDRAREQSGEIFNISGARALSVRAMVETLSQVLDKPVRFVTIPLPLAKVFAQVCELIFAILPGRPEPPLTRYTLSILAYSQTFRPDKARDGLGFVPRHDAMATAIEVAQGRIHAS